MSYIEAKKVLSLFNDLVNDCVDKDEFYNRAFDAVDAMPTADVVEVVRCKDCKHHDDCICVVCEEENTVVCKKMSRHFPKEHYCGYGERREE